MVRVLMARVQRFLRGTASNSNFEVVGGGLGQRTPVACRAVVPAD
jgi:hypothetical protein